MSDCAFLKEYVYGKKVNELSKALNTNLERRVLLNEQPPARTEYEIRELLKVF